MPKFLDSLNLHFTICQFINFPEKTQVWLNLYPEYIIKFIIKILRYFWGVTAAAAATFPAPAAMQGSAAAAGVGLSSVAPAQRRYHTRVGPTPPSPPHSRPARRAPPSKRARTSGPGESSTSRPRAPPSPPYQGITEAPDLSPASIIRRPYFHCSPILGNTDCSERDLHGEVCYDLPAFVEDPEL